MEGTMKLQKFIAIIFSLILILTFQNTVFAVENNQLNDVDSMLEKAVNDYNIPGMSVAIVDSERVIFSKSYGNCISADTPFIIGSLSKSFTAVCIMQLVEQKQINLDDSISQYIDVSDYLENCEDGDRITVRQLLNQTGGLDTYQRFGNAKITDSYGTHQYANVNYGLLGKIVESVSGETYENYVTNHIFNPLKMTNSAASLEKSKENGLIDGYRNYFGIPVAGQPDYPTDKSWSTVSAGYISSSASDMGRYLQMYINNGENILSKDSINTMFYDSLRGDSEGTYYYGMGWTTQKYEDKTIISHSGLVENYMSNMFILPDYGIGIVMLVNTNDYLVTNNLMNNVSQNILLLVMGETFVETSGVDYYLYHGLLDLAYILLIVLSIIPLIRIRKCKGKLLSVKNGVIHILIPTFLLCVPRIIGIPLWVVFYFVKDLFFVIVISAVILYSGGLIKCIIAIKRYLNSRTIVEKCDDTQY